MNQLVSIIIPIYNGEKWLNQCIDSVVAQTYKHIEIILVDDGSIDRSAAICDDYALKDSRIVVIHNTNAGVSAARNTGIEQARGKYIAFVDSDDYLSTDILEKAVEIQSKNKLLSVAYCKDVDGVIEEIPAFLSADITREEMVAAFVGSYTKKGRIEGLFRSVWGKLFERKIIDDHDIRFREGLYLGEDAVFVLEYLQYVSGLQILNEYGYYYRILQNSFSKKYSKDALNQYIMQTKLIYKLIETSGVTGAIIDASLSIYLWFSFYNVLKNGEQGIQLHAITRGRAVAETKKYYKCMKGHANSKVDIPWVRKFFRMQNRLGTGCPFLVQYIFTLYDYKSKEQRKIRKTK